MTSRLEQIISQRAGAQLHLFGYDQLGVARNVTVPQVGAIQDDYVVGPGDEIVIELRGQENNEYRIPINRNGELVLPRLNPISASGRTLGSLRQAIEAAVRRAYVATDVFISVAQVRQISVLVSGEVNNPGLRTLTGLSSAVDALLLSGGVKKTGSLRNIRISRGGHEYSVDLYGLLTNHGAAPNLRLADGDRILVPTLGQTVAIMGLVRHQAIFELPVRESGISVRNLIELAGGTEVRGHYRYSVIRVLADGRSEMVPLADDSGALHDSDILSVQLGADQQISQVTLSGGTGLAGQYPVAAGAKLSAMLKAPGALGPTPYTLFGIIVRKDPRTLLRTLAAFTPVSVLNGGEDETLQADDIVRPLSVNESRLLIRAVCTYMDRQAAQQTKLRNPLDTSTSSPSPPHFRVKTAPLPNQIPAACNPSGAGARLVSTGSTNPLTGAVAEETSTVQYPIVDQFADPVMRTPTSTPAPTTLSIGAARNPRRSRPWRNVGSDNDAQFPDPVGAPRPVRDQPGSDPFWRSGGPAWGRFHYADEFPDRTSRQSRWRRASAGLLSGRPERGIERSGAGRRRHRQLGGSKRR